LTDDWYFACGIDVVAPPATGAVVALGDSLTDANISTHDGHHSWPSQLARRLLARPSGRPMAVMNQGLGGNRILHDIRGDSGLRLAAQAPPLRRDRRFRPGLARSRPSDPDAADLRLRRPPSPE